MFILDSLFVSGLRWVLDTVKTAADAERDDDTALREELMAAEMRREMGEISNEEFAGIEADLLARLREIKERRVGGSGPIAFGGREADDGSSLQVEATVTGDFHQPPSDAVAGAVLDGTPVDPPRATRRAPSRALRSAKPARKTRRS